DVPDVDRIIEVHGVRADERDLQAGMMGVDLRDHRPFLVLEGDLPVRPQPGELPVHPHAETARMADRLVFLADVGEIDVPDSIVAVEGEEELAVAERDVPRHPRQSGLAMDAVARRLRPKSAVAPRN